MNLVKPRQVKVVCLVIALGFSFLNGVHAQSVPVDPSVAVPANDAKVEQDANGALYLEFKNASLLNVLIALSEVSKINFVAGTEIAGRQVNMSLDGVSLEQALLAIANGSNVTYDYIPTSDIIMFRASSDAPQLAPLFTRVFKLYFLRASKIREINAGQSSGGGSSSGVQLISGGQQSGGGDKEETAVTAIVKAIEKMLSERGSVSVDERSNSLIVTDTEDRLDRVAAVVAELDRPLNQVLISVILLETFEDLTRDLGIQWGTEGPEDGTIAVFSGANRDSTAPFSSGFFHDTTGFNSVLKSFFSLDGREPTEDVTYSLAGRPVSGTINYTTPGQQNFTGLSQKIRALQTASKLRVLAKPNILVMDNHPAIVKIITNAAIGEQTATTSTSNGSASSTANQTERAEVGTILRVTPQINTQDKITLTIEPTFSTLETSSIDVTGGAGSTADPTVRAARTTLMVNSGSTLVMGGLMFSDQSEGDRKVPYLGDLPIIGKAFTSTDKNISDRELVLFLSPQIIKNPASLDPGEAPNREDRFDNVNAEFWKYRKKNWYKEMQNPPPAPKAYEDYFKVRENEMDKLADSLRSGEATDQFDQEKATLMKQEIGKTGQATDIKWQVQ